MISVYVHIYTVRCVLSKCNDITIVHLFVRVGKVMKALKVVTHTGDVVACTR